MIGATPDTIAVSILSYLAGVVTGFIISNILYKRNMGSMNSKNSSNLVMMAITFIWFTSMLVDIVSPLYETSPYVQGLMGIIAGFFFKNSKIFDAEKDKK